MKSLVLQPDTTYYSYPSFFGDGYTNARRKHLDHLRRVVMWEQLEYERRQRNKKTPWKKSTYRGTVVFSDATVPVVGHVRPQGIHETTDSL